MEDYISINQKHWDTITPGHVKSEMYDVEGFKAGKTSLQEIELGLMEDVKGKDLLHLQCHFGQDTLSWARLGANVTGVDFSSEAIKTARQLSKEINVPANFVESNIYDLKDNLQGQYDVVFTSYGTIVWLADLHKWAEIIKHFLKPGGKFYFIDFHPTLDMFDWDTKEIAYDYFSDGKPIIEEVTGSYAAAGTKTTEAFFVHSIHQTMMPLINQGLQLLDFQEYDYTTYNIFGKMRSVGENRWSFYPKNIRFPHIYSMVFMRPL